MANGLQQRKQDGGDDYRRHVEATFARYDAVIKERDGLQTQVTQALNNLKQSSDELTLMRDEITSLRRQLEVANLRLVQAMAERACYETLFASMMAQMREFKIPAVPLIQTASADELQAISHE